MSKFEELCQVYATARKDYLTSAQMRQNFIDVFVQQMSDYFQCPIKPTDPTLDDSGTLHFSVLITLLENPHNPQESDSETVCISLTIDKVLDNYIVSVYPWGEEFKLFWEEFDKFTEVYDFIFEKIKETYIGGITIFSSDERIRNLGWGF
jgi:hypothetical protein